MYCMHWQVTKQDNNFLYNPCFHANNILTNIVLRGTMNKWNTQQTDHNIWRWYSGPGFEQVYYLFILRTVNKEVGRRLISKTKRQYNVQRKNEKRTNNVLQNTTQKTRDRATRTLLQDIKFNNTLRVTLHIISKQKHNRKLLISYMLCNVLYALTSYKTR
jgi:hypothetical protein